MIHKMTSVKKIKAKKNSFKKNGMGRTAKKPFGQCFFKNIGAWRGG